jgi:hypothetical protein
MRKGVSPTRNKKLDLNDSLNRVLMPVYIPSEDGYFKDSFEIFKLSIRSLVNTISINTRISIFLNGCDEKIVDWTMQFAAKNEQLDQILFSKINVGKINAIRALYYGNLEPFITVSDSDVLFKHDWEKEVFEIFKSYDDAGMVGLVPLNDNYKSFTSNVWGKYFLRGKIKFELSEDQEAEWMFLKSLSTQKSKEINRNQTSHVMTVTHNRKKAVIGCGHFVAVVKREIFDFAPISPNIFMLGSKSEQHYIDVPLVKAGYLRLCTSKGFAYHMGNSLESWMAERIPVKRINSRTALPPIEEFSSSKVSRLERYLGKLLVLILTSRYRYVLMLFVSKNKKD